MLRLRAILSDTAAGRHLRALIYRVMMESCVPRGREYDELTSITALCRFALLQSDFETISDPRSRFETHASDARVVFEEHVGRM